MVTDFAALGEKQQGGYFIHSEKTKDNWAADYQYDFSIQDDDMIDEWANRVIYQMTNKEKITNIDSIKKQAQERYDWKNIVEQWNKVCHQKNS